MSISTSGIGAVTRPFAAIGATGAGSRAGVLASVAEPPVQPDPRVISDPVRDPQVDPVSEPAPSGDDTWTDPTGRVYRKRVDAQTGHLLLEHHSEQAGANGARVTLDITIDLSPDGTATRTTAQRLDVPSGDFRTEQVVTSYDRDFNVVGEVSDSHVKTAAKEITEHTVDTYTTGKVTHRVTDLVQVERQLDPGTGERTEAEVKVTGTWDAAGQPITDDTVPTIDRTETARYTTPKQGINKDTDRLITSVAHAAGPLDAIRYDPTMSLVVRFDGHDGQYIERELSVPIGADGKPRFDEAATVRTDDHQKGYVKGLTQARIWGGLVSQVAAIVGINLLRSPVGGVARGLLWTGVAAGGAELVGETHALVDRRNDASAARLAMGLYDTTWLTLVAVYTRGGTRGLGQQVAGTPLTRQQALTGLAATGLAMHGAAQLRQPVGTGALTGVLDAGSLLARAGVHAPSGGSGLPGGDDWRAVERSFDATSALAPMLDATTLGTIAR